MIRYKPRMVFLFYFLLFSYPLLSLLWRRSYPVFTLETGILFLSLALFSFLLAVIFCHVRPVIVNLFSVLMITIVLMLQFNLLLAGAGLGASISVFVAWRLRGNFQLYALPVLVTLIVGAYLDSFAGSADKGFVAKPDKIHGELPPVVHILLDSFIGIDGLPPYPASKILSDELYTFFDHYNFHLFPRAYSRYMRTGDSMYSAMNFRNDGNSRFGLEVLGRSQHVLRSNALFSAMAKIGYRFDIYQTDYLDFCQFWPESLERCWKYSQPNVRSIHEVPKLQLRDKMLVNVLLGQSILISHLITSWGWDLDLGVAFHDPRVFSTLEDDLLSEPGGRYFFAHVLLPHGPFAFLHDCSIDYESPLWAMYAGVAGERTQREEIYEMRTMKYFEQVDCAVKSLRHIFEKMQQAGIYEHSIIIVHGDHGSLIGKSIPVYRNLEHLTTADYRANFSTLFAVRFPGERARVDGRTAALSDLLKAFAASITTYIKGPTEMLSMQHLPEPQTAAEPFVFIQGTHPMTRVDVDLFGDRSRLQ